MLLRNISLIILLAMPSLAGSQCFLVPAEVCLDACGPVFYLQNDPDGTTYEWSVSCGTITNENAANPHTVCFNTAGSCTIQVIVTAPGELPDTCTQIVEVLPHSVSVVNEEVCTGDSIEINGTYYVPGFYTDTIFGGSHNGCDSILLITVDSITNDTTDVTYLGCVNDSFSIVINGNTYDESNPVGIELVPGTDGCDSVLLINLQFQPPVFGNEIYIGCQGDGYEVVVDGNTYNESNPTGIDTLPAANGCDSIVNINLTFFPPFQDTISYQGCSGDGFSLTIGDSLYNESNPVAIHTIHGGCDTLIYVDLHFDTIPAVLTLTGNQICLSPGDLSYQWMMCDSTLLPDTGTCVTVLGPGCICVEVDNGTCIDTICQEYNACDISCGILLPETGCLGDSIFFQTDYVSATANYNWTIRNDTDIVFSFSGTDAWIVLNHSGCLEVTLDIEDLGCLTSCVDTICIGETPIADLCCDVLACDTCATLSITLFGNSPLSIAITDGSGIDTITGINTSQYDYTVCPPASTGVLYTLLWVEDASGICTGGIINESATVYLEEVPEAAVITTGGSLCAAPAGLSYLWTECDNPDTLSTSACFVPTVSGCYCLTVSTLLTGCIDSSCVEVIITGIDDPGSALSPAMNYDNAENAIVIHGLDPSVKYDFAIHDVQGRKVPFTESSNTLTGKSLKLEDQNPSFMIVTIIGDQVKHSQGIFIPVKE